jgi:hypothetical protein
LRRSSLKDGYSVEREYVWVVELDVVLPVRRMVIDAMTGEIFDEVWTDEAGRVQSYSTRRSRESNAPDRGQPGLVETVVPTSPRADDQMVEDGGDDGSLPSEGQVRPRLPQSGRVADMTLDDRDAA